MLWLFRLPAARFGNWKTSHMQVDADPAGFAARWRDDDVYRQLLLARESLRSEMKKKNEKSFNNSMI